MPEDRRGRRARLLVMARAGGERLDGYPLARALAGLIHERYRPETVAAAFAGRAPDIACTAGELIAAAG